MKYITTKHFDREFAKMPQVVRKAFSERIVFLVENFRHPSLRAKKYDEATDVWQIRITKNIRMFFRIEGDTYQLLNIRKHSD
ncbi:MAG TPA: hypothetical protein VJC04_04185 [Candidatus Paceibacterota bacterium]